MLVLGLKILGPSLLFAYGVYHDWSKQHDKSVRELVWRTAVTTVAVAAMVAVIVVDHRSQAAFAAAAQEEAAEARKSLQGLEESVAEVVAFVRERDPGLTEQEALDRVIEELRERAADLEDQLTGLTMYSAVSKLGVLGESGTAGPGLRENSPLIRALEWTWDDRDGSLYVRCDQTALAKFSAAAESHPSFPFTHYALSEYAFRAGDDAWRQHVDRALEILRHTTRIAGHHRHHAEVYQCLRSRLLLLRLFQHTPICSVGVCPAQDSPRVCPSFSANSPPKTPADSIWLRACGRTDSCVRAVGAGTRMCSSTSAGGNARAAGTRSR